MVKLTNELFFKEMHTLWKNNISTRELLGCMINDYFEGKRAKRIIDKLNEVG